jgi:hypothetical protein
MVHLAKPPQILREPDGLNPKPYSVVLLKRIEKMFYFDHGAAPLLSRNPTDRFVSSIHKDDGKIVKL